ncbi:MULTISPECIES: DMT family transporter [Leeuwenhoekiella]|jgi:drug/metabolite transporter (DMT)-like permease|uniref:DMT family transporter n=1 Tax=Leeuwenhoekiella TaxID=283735 RepID=UPI000C58CE54|nr:MULTISPECIES: DMT family transporter [Leeuwenhoekiella]MAO43927.1 permease [Leeuwenhoekiella sp.]MBQ52652.1 permease [Leeuwenhoekiella sp.]HBT09526.1 permease [Leeuwenhoekiella sp.]HCW64931.1 permease [Leeuwenhoekiella sp.]|tara:strand:- start:1669 stop:2562 length:894 start_codon:yes stop_codon:yes gene_type:complete
MQASNKKWLYLFILSLIWGTSYILIKKGLVGLTPLQLGAFRIIFTTIFLFLIGFRSLFRITKTQWGWVALSALLGTFLPVFLFAYAETQIDSSIASILNSLVPLFTIFLGFLLFKIAFTRNQVVGVILGLLGAAILIFQGAEVNPDQNYVFAGLVVIAALCYAGNANILKSKLQEVSSLAIAVGNFSVMLIPAVIVLYFAGGMQLDVAEPAIRSSLLYIVILAFFGTALAKILFNKLVQISSAVFSTSVTYLIPIVGIFWGLLDGERFTLIHLLGAGVILTGVYLVNANRKQKKTNS